MGEFFIVIGFGIMLVVAAVTLIPSDSDLKKFSIDQGIAHYDSKTGDYVQDSLVKINDSTIVIRKK